MNGKVLQKTLIKVSRIFLFGLLFLSSCTGNNASSIESSSTDQSKEALTTYRSDSGNYRLFLNGVTNNNKEKLAQDIFSNLNNEDKKKPVKFIDPTFVDADKYCYTKKGFDSFLCWSASTSNILRISGWAEDFTNPIIKERSTSYEDDLFSFFSANFTDAGNLSECALSYYFDGMLGTVSSGAATLVTEKSELKPALGSSYAGYQPKLCSSAFAKSLGISNKTLDSLSQMEKLETQATEISISKIDTNTKETLADSGHSMTLTGAVIDTSKTGKERYVALLIADSDNETSADELPTSFNDAYQVKKEKTNSYTLYFTDTFDDKFGFYGYMDHVFAEITDLTCLPFKKDANIDSYLENADYATCDKSNNGDLVTTFVSVFGENDNYSDIYSKGEKIQCNIIFTNRNESCPMTKENAGKDILQNSIEVYRDQKLIGTITDGLSYDLKDEISPRNKAYVQADLTASNLFTEAGEYEIKVKLNSNGCKEAYTLNNTSDGVKFTIK